LTPTERADDERPDPALFVGEGEGEGEDVDLEEVEVDWGSTTVDGPLGTDDDVLGIKVASGVLMLVLAMVLVPLRDGGTPEDGGRHLGALEESR
jgi:hypothetical protein